MKKRVILTAVLLFYSCLSAAGATETLNISFAKFKQVEGVLHFQVLDCANDQLKWEQLPVLTVKQVDITENVVRQSVSNLSQGTYCVRFFQDLNGNGALDLAANTVPKEPVGFSNNPNLMFGQPMPEDSVFELVDSMDIKIKVNNKKRR